MNRKERRIKDWFLNKNREYGEKPNARKLQEIEDIRVAFELKEKYPFGTEIIVNKELYYVVAWSHNGLGLSKIKEEHKTSNPIPYLSLDVIKKMNFVRKVEK